MRSLLESEEEAEPLDFVASYDIRRGAEGLATVISERLDFSLQSFRSGNGRGTSKGFAYLRERAEPAGIFVLLIGNLGSHHSALIVELFRGFALSNKVAPFVVINVQDSEQAWSFTLLHELAHIWLGQTGVSGGRPTSAIETFCNDVAGRILLPSAEMAGEVALRAARQDVVIARIGEIADLRQISHSMVA